MHGFRWVLLYSCALANSQNSAICNGSLARISNFLIDIRALQMCCINLGDTPIYYPSQGKKKGISRHGTCSACICPCLHLPSLPPPLLHSLVVFFPKCSQADDVTGRGITAACTGLATNGASALGAKVP